MLALSIWVRTYKFALDFLVVQGMGVSNTHGTGTPLIGTMKKPS